MYLNVFVFISYLQAFSVMFVCIAITSDMICLFFIPVHWLFFAASTYVWVQYVWHTGKLRWFIFCYRTHADICCFDRQRHLLADNHSLDAVRLLGGGHTMEGQSPYAAFRPVSTVCRSLVRPTTITITDIQSNLNVLPHSIGYPVVTLGFGFKSYVNYQMRQRKQREIAKENIFFVKLLQEALPAEQPLLPLDDSSAALNGSAASPEIASGSDGCPTVKDQQLLPLLAVSATSTQPTVSVQLAASSINSYQHSNTNTKHAQSQSKASGAGATTPNATSNGSANSSYLHSNGTTTGHQRANRRSCDKSTSVTDSKSYLQTAANGSSAKSSTAAKEANGKLPNHHPASDALPASNRDRADKEQLCNGKAVLSKLADSGVGPSDGSVAAKRQSSSSDSNDRGLCEIGGGPDKDSKSSASTSKTQHNGETTTDATVENVEKAPKG